MAWDPTNVYSQSIIGFLIAVNTENESENNKKKNLRLKKITNAHGSMNILRKCSLYNLSRIHKMSKQKGTVMTMVNINFQVIERKRF